VLLSLASGARPWPQAWPGRIVVVRGPANARGAVARQLLARLAAEAPGTRLLATPPAQEWPFRHPLVPPAATDGTPGVVFVPDLHEAFVNAQTNATRLVTTQPMYLLALWTQCLDACPDLRVLATMDTDVARAHGPEALDGRGPWRQVAWLDASPADTADDTPDAALPPPLAGLPQAFRADTPAERLTTAGRTLDAERTPAHLLAMASVCMEVNDLDNAGDLLREAIAAAPDWAAAHFEHGKWCLRTDDMPAAAEAFGAATRLLPAFSSAAANWGATLGELDRPDEALAAFSAALAADPGNPQALNNVGVVSRELGRLADSEAAFRQVIRLTPDLAFGHYNLGHTLFLQGRYQASLAAYQAGQRLDPARNPVQASRLALAKLATGDAAGALRDLQGCMANLPRDYRRQLLGDTQSVAWALLSAAPELRDWRVVGDWLAAELARA
jgi:tetratricopeptide (TPR) repeat protein